MFQCSGRAAWSGEGCGVPYGIVQGGPGGDRGGRRQSGRGYLALADAVARVLEVLRREGAGNGLELDMRKECWLSLPATCLLRRAHRPCQVSLTHWQQPRELIRGLQILGSAVSQTWKRRRSNSIPRSLGAGAHGQGSQGDGPDVKCALGRRGRVGWHVRCRHRQGRQRHHGSCSDGRAVGPDGAEVRCGGGERRAEDGAGTRGRCLSGVVGGHSRALHCTMRLAAGP